MRQKNPFHQPAKQWQIRIHTEVGHVAAIEEGFGDLALATLSFEVDEAQGKWCVDIITDVPPEKMDLNSRMALVSGLLSITMPPCEVKLLEPKDWLAEVQKSFPPLHVDRFYVYGTHIAHPPPHGKIALKVNAGAAFGSGEHATTSGCLRALAWLAKHRSFSRPLDMGCGSGILAIAMAKLWRRPVLGIDIDPVSVTVARENASLNSVHGFTRFEAGDGYNTREVSRHAPFDLIVGNILAKPLMRMAPELAQHLAFGGIAILSGLLEHQERMVLTAHRIQGLRLIRRFAIRGWNTLVLMKGG